VPRLTDDQRKKLAAAGFNDDDLKEVEGALVETKPSRRDRSKTKLLVMEGDTADSFIERWFGPSDETTEHPGEDEPDGDGEDDGDDTDTDEDETDADADDDKPDSTVGYFKDKRKRSA